MDFIAADLFCGAGGSSTGLVRAAEQRTQAIDLLAVNHWPVAVATHTRNHPWARHLCADLSSVDPSKVVPGGRLDLLIASPECTHHSNARGGKPCSDQSRASAWHVMHWCERLDVREVLIENVKEFASWGPLSKQGRPIKRLRGATFRAFVSALQSFGYIVDWKILNAADYGDATCRHRLFVRASKNGPITWPKASHAGAWRPAREIIDWSIVSQPISQRARPLAPKTMDRISYGLKKFSGTPFVIGQQSGATPRSVGNPLPTIATAGAIGFCEPFLVQYQGGDARRSNRVHSLDSPLPTQPTENRFALCEPFIIPMEHSGRNALRSTEQPLPTITTAKGGAFGLCEPFITKYYGNGGETPVSAPLGTITTVDRFALVEPTKTDVRFRMLQPHELAAAMGFDGYEFSGTKTDQVKQIGNAVAVRTAQALCGRILDAYQTRNS